MRHAARSTRPRLATHTHRARRAHNLAWSQDSGMTALRDGAPLHGQGLNGDYRPRFFFLTSRRRLCARSREGATRLLRLACAIPRMQLMAMELG